MWKLVGKIAGAIGVVGSIGAAALWLNSFGENITENIIQSNEGVMDSIAAVKQTVDYINVEQSMLSSDVQKIQDTLDNLENKVDKQSSDVETLTWVIQHRDQYTQDQLNEIMNEMLKKNLELTVSRGILFAD